MHGTGIARPVPCPRTSASCSSRRPRPRSPSYPLPPTSFTHGAVAGSKSNANGLRRSRARSPVRAARSTVGIVRGCRAVALKRSSSSRSSAGSAPTRHGRRRPCPPTTGCRDPRATCRRRTWFARGSSSTRRFARCRAPRDRRAPCSARSPRAATAPESVQHTYTCSRCARTRIARDAEQPVPPPRPQQAR